MDHKSSSFFLLFAGVLALLTSTSGCSGEGGINAAANEAEAADDPDVGETTQTVLKEGLSCDVQAQIVSMSPEDSQATRSALLDQLGQETLNDVINDREECDAASFGLTEEPVSPDGVGTVQQAITGTYTAVPIPEQWSVSAGWSPTYIFSDNDEICGPWYEWPKDYIAEFKSVANAYSSMSSLRMMGLNSDGECYIDGNTASRVYSDNDIRSCIGYWTVWGCDGTFDTGDIRVYHN